MTRSVRTSLVSSFSSAILVCSLGVVVVVDAALDAATDAPTDAPPLVCNAPTMNCNGACVNTTNSEEFCGNCTTACTGGRVCTTSACACPTITIPATLSGGIGAELQGFLLGSSEISGDALIIALDPTMTTLAQGYPMTEANLGTLPTAGFGVGVDLLAMTADASFAATAGTLTITKICRATPNAFPPDGGVMGTLTNARFSAVDGLLQGNPVIVPGGCTIPATGTIASISFSLGNVGCGI